MKKTVLICFVLLTFTLKAQKKQYGFDEPFKVFERNKTLKFEKPPKSYKFIDYTGKGSVNTTNGRFELTVPFYEIKNNYINLPIGLNYSTSGVKMSEDFSCVGIDWELVAGGEITREVKGMPDDLTSGEGSHVSKNHNAFTGREYHYPNFNGVMAANFGGMGSCLFKDEKYKQLSNLTSSLSHPRYFGSIRSKVAPFYMYHFPRRFSHPSTRRYGYLPKLLHSIRWTFHEMINKSSAKGMVDLQRDIFKVNVGNLHFSFILQEKKIPYNPVEYRSSFSDDWGNDFVAVPLNEKGIKIEFIKGSIPLYQRWLGIKGNKPFRSRLYKTVIDGVEQSKYINHIEGIVGFIVTDKKGVKYHFNQITISDNEFLIGEIDNNYVTEPKNAAKNVKAFQWGVESSKTSKWKISKIELPNGKNIEFTYQSVIQEHDVEVTRSHTGQYKGYRYNLKPLWHPTTNDIYVTKRLTTHKLKKITTDKEEITFEYENRLDLKSNGSSGSSRTNLRKIKLKSQFNGKLIREFQLNKTYYSYQNSSDYRDRRMFLTSIKDSREENTYNFSYNSPTSLKRKNTGQFQDIWGYPIQNSSYSHPSFPSFYVSKSNPAGYKIMYTKPKNPDYFVFRGANRFVDKNYVSKGALEKINFPTKGFLEVNYEPNTYYDTMANNSNVDGPGIRVKSLKYYDSDNTAKLEKRYDYTVSNNTKSSSGEIIHRPSFAYITNDGFDNEIDRSQVETKSYTYYDNSFFISYNKKKGILKKGKNIGESNDKMYLNTTNQDFLLKKLIEVSNYPIRSTFDNSGNEIIYKRVKEYYVDINNKISSGYKVYTNFYEDNRTLVKMEGGVSDETQYVEPNFKYENFSEITVHGNPWHNWYKISYGLMEIQGKDIFPFPQRNYYGNFLGRLNGKTKKIEFFDSNNILQRVDEYEYYLSGNKQKKINNISRKFVLSYAYDKKDANQKYLTRTNGNYIMYRTPFYYELILGMNFFHINELHPERKVLLKSKNTTDAGVHTTINYSYDDKFVLNTKSSFVSSKNETMEKEFIYPFQVSTENDNSTLVSRNILLNPVKMITRKKGVQTDKYEHIYKKFASASFPLLSKQSYKKGNTPSVIDKIVYDKYDKFGNSLQYHIPNGATTSIIWGLKGNYPIAKVEGVSYDTIMNYLNTDDKNTLKTSMSSLSIRIIINKLRNKFTNAQITTYEYDPLVGIKTITDPRGYRTHYEYDDFFRLKYIKDEKGNIIESYKYNYKK